MLCNALRFGSYSRCMSADCLQLYCTRGVSNLDNLYEFFHNSYEKYPNNYYVFDQKYWTYDEVYQCINSMTVILTKNRIKVNDKVILYMENSIEYIISYFAILYLGATVVPITISSTFENISNIVDDCKPVLVLTSESLFSHIKNTELVNKTDIKSISIKEIGRTDYVESQQCKTGQLAMIIYTSGTTNEAKGVMLTHKNLIANTEAILDYLRLDNSDSTLATLPFTYSYGNSILLTHTKASGLLYLSRAAYPQAILSLLKKENITGFSTVGSYLNILLKQENFTPEIFGKLRYITLAGEHTAKSDLIKLKDIDKDLKIYVMYGQTEASARLTYLEPSMLYKKIGSVGKPIKNVTLKIIDEDGKEVECGESGEIIVKGENIMAGYLNKPDETKEVLKNGWLYTGDIAYKDSDGYIYITGRKNDIIKYFGYRISPMEIENYINMHANILESAVVAYHNEDNVKIAAVIVLKDDKLDISDLSKTLKKSLPLYKIPSIFHVVDQLPKTSNGKIKRGELKEMLKKSILEDCRM